MIAPRGTFDSLLVPPVLSLPPLEFGLLPLPLLLFPLLLEDVGDVDGLVVRVSSDVGKFIPGPVAVGRPVYAPD